MFHLFAGLQVIPDISCGGFGKEFVISKFEDYELPDGVISIKALMPSRIQMFGSVYVETYEDLPYKNDVEFFSTLYDNDKSCVDVYADCKGYATIVCKFIKLIFPEKNAETAYLEYKLSLDKFYIDYVYNRNTSIQYTYYPIKTIRDNFVRLNEKQFIELFNSTVITGSENDQKTFRQKVSQELSTEYQIASLLLGDTRFERELDYQIKNTILRVLASSVQEVNPFVTYNIFTGLYQFTNNVNQDIKACIDKLHIADLLNNDSMFAPTKTFDYGQYNAAYERLATFLTECHDFGWDATDMEYARKCIKYLHEDYNIKDVIVDMLTEHDVKIFIFSEVKNINPLLLFHIFDLYKQDKIDHIAKFAIS